MAGLLSDYLAQAATRGFEIGKHDCATFAAGWLDIATGLDGLQAWLGQYHDEASCAAFIAVGGGMVAIADAFIGSRYGLARTTMPRHGNALVAQFNGVDVMGIRVSGRDVAILTPNRLFITRRVCVLAEWGEA